MLVQLRVRGVVHKDSKASGVGTAKDPGVVSKAGGAGAA